MDIPKTCPPYDQRTHRPVPDAFDEVPDGVGGTQWVQRIEALTTAEIAEGLASMRAERIATVKAEAERRILAIAPIWKQANLTARASELALLYPNSKGIDLPEPERSEYLVGQALWDRIKAIRDASNQIEARLVEAVNRAALLAVDVSVGWPD